MRYHTFYHEYLIVLIELGLLRHLRSIEEEETEERKRYEGLSEALAHARAKVSVLTPVPLVFGVF